MNDQKQKMLKDMRALWKRDPALFEQIINEYNAHGPSTFPADKRRRTSKQGPTLDLIWASVEFLMWRDGIKTVQACEKLAKHGVNLNLYDSPTGMWRVGEEPQPDVFSYAAEGVVGKSDGENIRKTYNDAQKRTDMVAAMNWLTQMKAAYRGENSGLDKEFLSKALPPL